MVNGTDDGNDPKQVIIICIDREDISIYNNTRIICLLRLLTDNCMEAGGPFLLSSSRGTAWVEME